jgi:tetratricopeptide (TPR) repeat protein
MYCEAKLTNATQNKTVGQNQEPKLVLRPDLPLFKVSEVTGKPADTETAVVLMNEALSTAMEEDSQAIQRILSRVQLYKDRYERLGKLADLEKIIEIEQQAVLLTPQDHSNMPARLNNLGFSLEGRFNRLGQLADLEKAIDLKSQAVSLTPQDDPDMPTFLSNLACSLESKFNRLDHLTDLNRAIEYMTQAVLLTPEGDSDVSRQLSNLGCMLQSRYERLAEVADLQKAIEYLTKAASLTAQGQSSMPIRLINLGGSLTARFERLGELEDLQKAIECMSQAVSLTPQGHPKMHLRLNNLGCSYERRFERTGELDDLNKAIKYKSQAVSLAPQDHSLMPNLLNNLGCSFESRFRRLGELPDLNRAIEYKNQAVTLTPRGHSDMPRWLSNLGISLQRRFNRLGELADIDKAIEHQSQAVSLTPQGHSEMPTRLLNFGGSLGSRFKRLENLMDLVKALQCLNQALLLTPPGHTDLPRLHSALGSAFYSRFKQHGELTDLNKAIEHHGQAVSLTPKGHFDMPRWLNNLGFSLRSRFEQKGELVDFDKAIEYQEQAVSLTPHDDPSLPARLSNLGDMLENRFQQLGGLKYLDKAIECKTRAVSLTPQGHSDMSIWLGSLGFAYAARFDSSGLIEDIENALDFLQKAAEYPIGSPFHKFKPTLKWAELSVIHRPSSALTAYQQTMSLLPQLVWQGISVHRRYQRIHEVGSLTTDAAAVAIKMKDDKLALEWLEEGRMIIWKQMLQLRTPVDDLAAVHPSLALQLQQVARELDLASSSKLVHEAITPDDQSQEMIAQHHRRLAEKWEELIEEVRLLTGFETFLLPRKACELMHSAQSGPVVVVNLNESSCDALIIQPNMTEILHVPLSFSHDRAMRVRVQLNQMVRGEDLTSRYFIKEEPKPTDDFGNTLSALWEGVVKPVLRSLGYMVRLTIYILSSIVLTTCAPQQSQPTGNLPHITWCTTGPLSFLPLHAAGNYNSNSMIFRYVVSSYTPNLSALLFPPPAPSNFSGILTVGQSSTQGLPRLPGTVTELARVADKCKGLDIVQLDGDSATPASVLAGMNERSWVHLACHAMQHVINPMQSAFYLHGGTLDLETITQKPLKHADLAFLSACQTAKGDRGLAEEGMHLAAGMLLAGYRTVIATMWSIGDRDAPLIAEVVYDHLLEGGRPDARRAAVAVHKATEQLRAKVGVKAFAQWVPYIHIGL